MTKRIFRPIFVVALLLCVAVLTRHDGAGLPGIMDKALDLQPVSGKRPFSLDETRALFADAADIVYKGKDLAEVRGENNVLLGWIAGGPPEQKQITGFSGRVPFLIGLDRQGRIKGVHMLPSWETPQYARRVSERLRNAWNGMRPAEAVTAPVDAVTGATQTSQALIDGVRGTLSHMSGILSAETVAAELSSGLRRRLVGITTWIFLVAALGVFQRPLSLRFRRIFQACSVLVPGVLAARMLALPQFAAWLRGDIAWRTDGFLLTVALFALGIPLLYGRNFYCYNYCPFGSAQDLAGRLQRRKLRPGKRMNRFLAFIRLILLVSALMIVVTGAVVNLAGFEPFAAFRWHYAPAASRILALLFLFTAVWIPRPWCRICPTGGLIEALRR